MTDKRQNFDAAAISREQRGGEDTPLVLPGATSFPPQPVRGRGRPPGSGKKNGGPKSSRVLYPGRTKEESRVTETSRDQIDFHRCYNEAEELFLLGQSLESIASQLNVMVARLEGWAEKYGWRAKLVTMMTSPSGIAAMLREQLRQEVRVTVTQGKMDLEAVERITRLTTLINKVEGGGFDFLAAASVVIRRFSVYLRGKCSDREEYHLVSTWVQNFLRTLTDC